MIALDSRRLSILTYLLQASSPLSTAEIAEKLGISARMVRFALDDVGAWLNARHVNLIRRPGYGLEIDASNDIKRTLLDELAKLTGYSILLSPSERLHILLLSLLTKDEPALVKQFEILLNVSRTTTLKDLDHAEAWLEEHGLTLIRRPNYGCLVEGSERTLREALADLLLHSLGEIRLLGLLSGPHSLVQSLSYGDVGLMRQVRELLGRLDVAYVKRLIRDIEDDVDIRLVDNAYVVLVLHFTILIWRIQQGHTIQKDYDDLIELRTRPVFTLAERVAKQIISECRLELDDPEVAYIALKLLQAEIAPSDNALLLSSSHDDRFDVTAIVNEMLDRASAYLHPGLKVDEQIKHDLSAHLSVTLDQIRFGLPVRNPLLSDVKRRYPRIFSVSQDCATILAERLDRPVPEAETGNIALCLIAAMERLHRLPSSKRRVLVVCHAGIATSGLLVSRLRVEFPELEIVDVISALKLQQMDSLEGIGIIVCTVPLDIDSIPTVVVSPFLTKQDIVRLRQALTTERPITPGHAARQESAPPQLMDLLTEKTIAVGIRAKTWQKAVNAAGQLLVDQRAVQARFVEAMKNLIIEHGPYMVIMPGVALLHAYPHDGVQHLCMSLVTFEEPVPFGHPENDPVVVAIALGASDSESHIRALMQLHRILRDRVALDMILNAQTPADVLSVLANHFPEHIKAPTS
jgi:mannitol operon transcriptional antiterminator